MAGKLFTWKDIRRIVQHVWQDEPLTEDQWIAWLDSVNFFAQSPRNLLRRHEELVEGYSRRVYFTMSMAQSIDALVTGFNRARIGFSVAAYIVPKPKEGLSHQEIEDILNRYFDRLEIYKEGDFEGED